MTSGRPNRSSKARSTASQAAKRANREPSDTAAAAPWSLRRYAKHRGVSAEAVSLAISEGRLTAGVVRAPDGSPKIGDVAAADLEWQPQADRRRGGLDPALAADLAAARLERDRADAERARTQAEMARMDLDERRGRLVNVDQARADVEQAYAIVKSHLRGVPNQLGQRWPLGQLDDGAHRVIQLVGDLIDNALNQLADGGPFEAARASATKNKP